MIAPKPIMSRTFARIIEKRPTLQLSGLSLLGAMCLAVWGWAGAALADDGVPASRYQRMTRGINVGQWFSQSNLSIEHFRNHITDYDVRLIAAMGFLHVRLPVDPAILFDKDEPEKLHPENLAELDRAIDMFLNQGLAVIVDIHSEYYFKEWMNNDDEFVGKLEKFWTSLASHLAERDPEYLYLELFNEPRTKTAEKWSEIRARLVKAARRGASHHTLIVSGHSWGDLERLLASEVVEGDSNIVYSFHYYQPFIFTHQGAGWVPSLYRFRGLPYPSSPSALAPIVEGIEHEPSRRMAERYGREEWNAVKIRESLQRAAEWASSNGVHVVCTEFGVFREVAPPADRSRLIRDIRTACDDLGIGWCMWDYSGVFGLMRDTEKGRYPDTDVFIALGLKEALEKEKAASQMTPPSK